MAYLATAALFGVAPVLSCDRVCDAGVSISDVDVAAVDDAAFLSFLVDAGAMALLDAAGAGVTAVAFVLSFL